MDFAFFVDSPATHWVLTDRRNRPRALVKSYFGIFVIAVPAHLMTTLLYGPWSSTSLSISIDADVPCVVYSPTQGVVCPMDGPE
jgi:hypothetical protein